MPPRPPTALIAIGGNSHEVAYVCPEHGREGILDVEYDYGLISLRFSPQSLAAQRDPSIWRYRPLLPIAADAAAPPLAVGWTPLYETPRLAAALGLRHLWIKDDSRQATGSFKDRASALAVVKAREAGAPVITTASTGNAAAALAGLCASVQQRSVIFVPESAPPAKIAQLLAYGATVLLVQGSYDDAFDLCLLAAEHYGWYNRNTAFNYALVLSAPSYTLTLTGELARLASPTLTPGPSPRGRGESDRSTPPHAFPSSSPFPATEGGWGVR